MRRGALWTALGVLLLGAALGLTLRNLRQDRQAGDAAAAVTAQLTRESAARKAARAAETQPAADGAAEAVPDYVRHPGMEMPVTEVDGTAYIGVLTIPALDLALPVQSEWSYPALRRTPCRYGGSAYRDDLILLAHNYESHFGRLKSLSPGDAVLFTDADGNEFAYEVLELEMLRPTAVEDMTAGDWDLTLFTCTLGGQARVTVRCLRTDRS